MKYTKEYIVATYMDEKLLFEAINSLKSSSIKIDEVYTPYPVHGLDKILNMRDTKLHTAGFIYGAIGLVISLVFMSWVMLVDWPINYSGKPLWSLPAFMPIIFEFTVLLSAVGMVCTFMYLCRLAPGVKKHHFNPKSTDDTFTLVINLSSNTTKIKDDMIKQLQELKALSVETQQSNPNWWFGDYASKHKLYEEGEKHIIG